jgi:hypothetical protein
MSQENVKRSKPDPAAWARVSDEELRERHREEQLRESAKQSRAQARRAGRRAARKLPPLAEEIPDWFWFIFWVFLFGLAHELFGFGI